MQHIDPWNVKGDASGKIDYNKLIEQVGGVTDIYLYTESWVFYELDSVWVLQAHVRAHSEVRLCDAQLHGHGLILLKQFRTSCGGHFINTRVFYGTYSIMTQMHTQIQTFH